MEEIKNFFSKNKKIIGYIFISPFCLSMIGVIFYIFYKEPFVFGVVVATASFFIGINILSNIKD